MILFAFLAGLFTFLLFNVPVAFALLLTGILLMGLMGDFSPFVIVQSMVRGIGSFSLLAIPFFVMAGEIMNKGGISRRIVNFAKAIIGHITGGLGYCTVLASMIFAGISGSAIADTTAIGSILLPIMERDGYDVKSSTALVCTAGCIGPVIPPSIPMILFGVTTGVSVVKLFLGGIIPGVLIGVGLMIVWYFHAKKHGYRSDENFSWQRVFVTLKDAFWAVLLPIIILGGIVSGIVTPTESAVVAVAYALFVTKFIYKELVITRDIPEILMYTAKQCGVVLTVCGSAMAAGYYITTAQVPQLLANALLSVSDNIYVIMLLINLLLLLIGCVMDLTPAILIMAPIMFPVAMRLGLNPIYFGVIMCTNLCIGLVTPPVGTVLYVGCGLSRLKIADLIKPLIPFIAVMFITLLVCTYISPLITFIPSLVS
ncbi:TRAP transporter large permease [Oscillospiraceae bacterium LTW-04]|nr:TRAP transporter large permease [Oscillospiraceae bacterium MB24-C1]